MNNHVLRRTLHDEIAFHPDHLFYVGEGWQVDSFEPNIETLNVGIREVETVDPKDVGQSGTRVLFQGGPDHTEGISVLVLETLMIGRVPRGTHLT